MSDPAEAQGRRLAELTEEIESSTHDALKLSAERIEVMLALHDLGWNNVQIATAAGLTRARVSTILKPLLEARPRQVVTTG